MRVLDSFKLKGRLRLFTQDAVTGAVVGDSETDNLIVTSGLNSLAAALNWAFVQNYNTSWGSPFLASSGNLADVYGAVGLSLNTPVAADVALGSEVGRQLITTGTNSSNVITYQFFFPTASGNGIITEVGVFTNATTQQVSLTVALNQNQTYTSLAVSATTAVIPSGAAITIGYGTSVTQQAVTSGSTSIGATTINVTSFIAGASFATGSLVAYNTGTLLDHALLAVPVTKTSAQTATLQLSMTLQSA